MGLLAAVSHVVIQWVSSILGVILSNFALSAFQTLFYHATYIFCWIAYLLCMLVAVRVVCFIMLITPTLHKILNSSSINFLLACFLCFALRVFVFVVIDGSTSDSVRKLSDELSRKHLSGELMFINLPC